MKNFFEKLQDILYDFMDYIIMLLIVVAVVGIIGWRLDILFAKDNPSFKQKDPSTDTAINKEDLDDESDSEDEDKDSDETASDSDNKESNDEKSSSSQDEDIDNKDSSDSKKEDKDKDSDQESKSTKVKINIPKGSSSQAIADILKEEGLIDSENDFHKKVESMGVEKYLRADDYEIDSDSSLEKIIKIISNQE